MMLLRLGAILTTTAHASTIEVKCSPETDFFVRFWFRLTQRTRLGIIATLMMTCAVVLLLSWYDTGKISRGVVGMLPFGVILFLIWLAWNDLEKIPWTNWIIMFAILIVCMIKPGAWFVGVPIIGYILFVSRKKR